MFKGKYDYSRHSSWSSNYSSEVVKESYSPMDMVDKSLLEQRINRVLGKVKEEMKRLKSVEDLDKEFNISPERFNLVESPYTEEEIVESLNQWNKLEDYRKSLHSLDFISKTLKRELLLKGFSGEGVLARVVKRLSRLSRTLDKLLDKLSIISSPSIPFDFKGVEYLALLQLEEHSKDWNNFYNELCESLNLRNYDSVIRLAELGVLNSDRDFYTFIEGKMFISESLLKEVQKSEEGKTPSTKEIVEKGVDPDPSPKYEVHSYPLWWDLFAPLAFIIGAITFIIYNVL